MPYLRDCPTCLTWRKKRIAMMTEQRIPAPPHRCAGNLPDRDYDTGSAIYQCAEDNGRLWIKNDEYASQVNYCPYCGYKAPVQLTPVPIAHPGNYPGDQRQEWKEAER